MSKNRRKPAEAENRARMDRHSHEKATATRLANHQREVQLGRARLNGLHPVRMDSIADALDEVDPKVRGMVAVAHRPAPPAFVPPRFQPSVVREKAMSPAAYVSPNRVTLRRVETINPKTGKKTGGFGLRGFKLPPDVVRRLIDRVDGLVLEVELNDDGILFRPAGNTVQAVSLPAWVPLKK